MGLRIGNMVWSTTEELKELLALVNEALSKSEKDDKYFEQLGVANSLCYAIEGAVKTIDEQVTLFNMNTGERFILSPGDSVLASTTTMVDWETSEK